MRRVSWPRRRLCLLALEDRLAPAAPNPPVIIEPFADGQVTGTFDINLQTEPAAYFDADGDAWQSTEWVIRTASGGTTVWQTGFLAAPPLTLYRVDFSDGVFVGPLAGATELDYETNYQLVVRYRDANNETSAPAVRNFQTAGFTQPVPGAGTWLVRPGYVVEPVQSGLRLPVNVAFVPNPGPNPNDPLYYVAELYGSIRVVTNSGAMSTFATGLLDYNPEGPISGSGEQGLTGLAVERDAVDPNLYRLYVGMLWDNGAPPGGPNHYPKVERLTSTAGGLALGSRTVLLNMQPETQGQSHQISNITIGPDGKLYVHMGDGFDASTGLNLDQYRGKVLRMNKDGSPVATGDPAGANPFYNAGNGINARDYVWTYGHRNPFGGAWRVADGKHWIVENGNGIDRMVDLTAGASYGWSGSDTALQTFSKYVWNPSHAPVNIDFVESTKFGGSGFPAESSGHAFVTLSGSTYAAGPSPGPKSIVEFTDLTTLNGSGKLAVAPTQLVKYNGTGRATLAGIAAGPDGLYFTDLYEDTGVNGPTGVGANVWRVRYVGNTGGAVPTVATPAAANPPTLLLGQATQLSVLGADDGGENNLTYSWGTTGNPPAPVGFSVNASNAAKNTVATFTANGTYSIFVAIRDAGGQTAISTVTVTVSSILTDTGNGVAGAYYNNIDFTGTLTNRVDPAIDFDWGLGAPIGGYGSNTFSVRWTGFVLPRFTETYTFYTTTDDGVRLWVNNLTTPIINQFVDQGATTWTGTISLQAGVLYQLRMDYYENQGDASARLEWSSPSQPRQVVPQGRLYTAVPSLPAAPTNLAATSPSASQINLTWTDNAGNEQGFKIERSTDGVNFALLATVPANTTNFSDTGLSAGTTYTYRLRSTNPAGDSGAVTVSRPTRPAPVVGLGVTPGNGQVALVWAATPGATSYNVYRGTTSGGQGPTPIASGLTNPNYLDAGVTNGVTYYYKVTAANLSGEGQPSEETVATPLAANPPTVSGIQVNDGTAQRSRVTQLQVTFSALVTLGGAAFVLTDLGGTPVPDVALSINSAPVGGVTVSTITFGGSAVIGGSLPDGRYRLRVVAGQVTNAAAPNSPMAADVTAEFHRLFGDADGDADVDAADFGAFRTAFGGVSNLAFDFDGDGDVDAGDFGAFRARFGTSV